MRAAKIVRDALLFFILFFVNKNIVFSEDYNIKGLPVVESLSSVRNDYFILLISGDGGWKNIDKQLSKYFNDAGISVVGFDCFSYFSKHEKTRAETANDMNRIINFYLGKLAVKKFIIMGYSFGADIIPFIYNRLPSSTKEKTEKLILLGITRTAQFKIDIREFIGLTVDIKTYPTIPELAKITDVPLLCICGVNDKTAACMFINQSNAVVKNVPGSHHFNENYKYISGMMIDWINQ